MAKSKTTTDKATEAAEAVTGAAEAVVAAAEKEHSRDRYQTVVLPIALAAITAISGYFSYRASIDSSASRAASRNNGERIDEVHTLVNSRLTELLELTRKNSRAEGVLEGKAAKEEP